MFAMPMSSPQITRIFGFRPDGEVVVVAGAAFCLWASAAEIIVAIATSADEPSRIFRRLRAWLSASFDGASLRSEFPGHTAKSDVAGRRIDRFGVACGRAVAAAIVGSAQMRAAFEDFTRNLDGRLAGIVTRVL